MEDEPELMEENEICKKRRVSAALSPSRSGSTLTSGDLGDISSSSLSAKTGSGPSSLERAASSLELSHPAVLPSTHSLGDVGKRLELVFLIVIIVMMMIALKGAILDFHNLLTGR